MSSIDDTSIDNNKDYDGDEFWSDSRLENALFNQLIDTDNKYINQAVTKFRYFRLNSPDTIFDIDVGDLTDEIINQLELCIRNYENKEEKYNRLNSICTNVIFSIYKNGARPQILSNTTGDKVMVERTLNEMPSVVFNKWMLVDLNQKIPSSSCLYELIGYVPSSTSPYCPISSSMLSEEEEKAGDHNEQQEEKQQHSGKEKKKTPTEDLMEIAEGKIDLLFKDQYEVPFAKIFVKNHFEIISLKSSKFEKFLSSSYHKVYKAPINSESITNVIRTLQAKAEFGDIQYGLSLRVAEYDGDMYYDLTNEKHQCVKISKNGTWEVLDCTPIPLFKRYNQIAQTLPFADSLTEEKEQDPLETFISKFTNIKDEETKLLVKVALLSYFVPNIPHIILIIHGGKGSAKSTFQLLIKNIVDPAKPSLLTLHDNPSEFIQQLSHNYLATYDNMKYVPKWLSDEVCKAVTGIGQTRRRLYTDDEDIIYEYKHCLNFNGINNAFSEPDVIDRSIIIELAEIDDKDRRTEQEIKNEFYALRPKLLVFIFNTLAKAMTIRPTIKIKRLPRMADSSLWGEALSRALGNKENEFINAYYKNIGFQNSEAVDSNPLAFAIKKYVERLCSDYNNNIVNSPFVPLYEGTPLKLLDKLNQIATQEGINTYQRDWPKDRKWLVKRINIIKSNLQQVLGIKISIDRSSRDNTSIVKIEKNNSGNSGENKMSPENESLSPYLDDLSPENPEDLSTKSIDGGDTGDTGDKFNVIDEEVDNTEVDAQDTNNIPSEHRHIASSISLDAKDNRELEHISYTISKEDDNNTNIKEAANSEVIDQMIGYKEPLFHCKQHPKVQNIHREEIEHHILNARDHKSL